MTLPRQANLTNQEDIAIVGMACVFPGADSIERYWHNIVNKVDCISDAPPDWQPERFYDPAGKDPDKSYTQRGGFLGDLATFNPVAYGVPPRDIEGAEPDHFLALRCAHEALVDAGYPDTKINRDKTGVIVGRGIFVNRGIIGVFQRLLAVDQVIGVLRQIEPERSEADLRLLRAELQKDLPPLNADTFPGLVHSALVGRIANRLDLHGPAYTVDAACASVHLALENAVRDLRLGTCDAVIVGGSQVSIPAAVQIGFCTVEALSRAGKIAPFSADAAGTLLGQGCGMLVVKRRTDAERDGNRIYALVKGIGSSSDGKGAGILAPLTEGQQLALRRAYEQTGLSPSAIDLIEAHGTGIPKGDATEIETLNACFGLPRRENERGRVAIGSSKSMLGHLVPASGAASLIKTALALYHRVTPPTLHAETPNPELRLESTRFRVADSPTPWLNRHAAEPRRAGVNAFGFGGINAHAILEEPANDESSAPRYERLWDSELVVVSASDREVLRERVGRLIEWVELLSPAGDSVSLLDIAAASAKESGACRLSVVAKDLDDLIRKLKHAAKLLADPDRSQIKDRRGVYWHEAPLGKQGRVAFLFPGEGAQYVGMTADLCRHFPEVRRQLDFTEQALSRGGKSLQSLLFPAAGRAKEAERDLQAMDTAVAAVTAVSRGLLQLLASLGVKADAVAGHSSGEFAAVVACGAFTPANDQELIESIVSGIDSTAAVAGSNLLPEAVLLTVGGAASQAVQGVVDASEGKLVVAMDNCPNQVVLVGDEAAISGAEAQLKGRGGLCQRIPWDRPYHTDAAEPICSFVQRYADALRLQPPRVELWSCATAEPVLGGVDEVKRLGVEQWRRPVRFRETIDAMHNTGCRVFIEAGPRGNLSAFVADTLAERPHAAIPLDLPTTPGMVQLCRAVGMLVAHGVEVDLPVLYERRGPRPIDFNDAPRKPKRTAPVLRLDLPIVQLSDEAALAFRQQPDAPLLETSLSQAPDEAKESTSAVDRNAIGSQAACSTSQSGSRNGSANRVCAPAMAESSIPTAPPTSVNAYRTARDSGMAEFQKTMRQFLEVQQNVLRCRGKASEPALPSTEAGDEPVAPAVASPAQASFTPGGASGAVSGTAVATATAATPAASPTTAPIERQSKRANPLLREVLEHEPCTQLIAECEFDVREDRFLLDHAFFGRGLSRNDSDLTALPVMPLAVMLELMAEAGRCLAPELEVAALCNVECLGWLAFETDTRRVRVSARRTGDTVDVTLLEADSEGADRVLVRGEVELAPELSELGPSTLPDQATEPPPWSDAELYGGIVYHGPAFQGIEKVERWGDGGIAARVSPSVSGLILNGEPSLLPVALIDTASQVPGLRYTNYNQVGDTCRLTFPKSFERLEVDRSYGPATGPLRVVAAFEEEPTRLRSDVEVCDASGAAVLRYRGRTEQVIDIPLKLYRYAFEPDRVWCSRDITSQFAGVEGIEQVRVTLTADPCNELYQQAFWRQVAARMVLGRAELQEFTRKRVPSEAACGWLLSRMAAKDAARLLRGADWTMADIVIDSPGGTPPRASALGGGMAPLLLSLSHKPLAAAAAAADTAGLVGIGVDLEPVRGLPAEVVEDAFDFDERKLLEEASNAADPELVCMAAWTAKEAAGKALGSGLPGGMRGLRVSDIDIEKRMVVLSLRGSLAESLADSWHSSKPITAHWRVEQGHVVALVLLPVATRPT